MIRSPFRCFLLSLALCLLSANRSLADEIRFRNGNRISGRIVTEDEKSVTIDLEGGGRATFERTLIEEILRDDPDGDPGAAVSADLLRVEHSFVWGGGKRLGTRTVKVRKLPDGGVALEEDSVFFDEAGKEDVRIVIVETANEALEPVQIVYRVMDGKGGLNLLGEVRGETLDLTVSVAGERRRNRLKLPEGVRFPLGAREFAIRHRKTIKGAWEVPVFDPREENFFKYRFENLGTRRVDWRGEALEVVVITRQRGERGAEEIWLNPAGEAVTEELNAAELVAVRSTSERIKALREGRAVQTSPEEERVRPLFIHPEAGFRLKKPNLSWTFKAGKPGEATLLTISSLQYFAYVEVFQMRKTPEGGLLSTLAVEMEKLYSANSKGFEKVSDGYLEVAGVRAYRMEAKSTNKGEKLRSWLVGFLADGKAWQIAMAVPVKYWPGAKPEFEAILGSFELLK